MTVHAPQRTATPEVPLDADPLAGVRAWPAHEPLAALCSGPGARWTVLTRPTRGVVLGADDAALPAPGARSGAPHAPFAPGWIGMVPYEAGRRIEPRAAWRPGAAPGACVWHRCDGALVHDRATGEWRIVGDPDAVPRLRSRAPEASAGPPRPLDGRDRYVANVERTIEYIRAGDVYQANIAHRLGAPFDGSARALFIELMRASGAWHGAYLEWDDAEARHAVVSASPELFLRLDGVTGRVVTRPMKGTAPADAGRRALLASDKDHAELNMIVDLMRNDLGRVCRCGSVRVEQARAIERHGLGPGALHQGVATVAGILREGLGPADLLAAAFPGGSVTGAPKIRAMQIIDELEGFDRGAFCGAIGYLGDDATMQLSVGIRTASILGAPGPNGRDDFADGRITYPVGAGIVADSEPCAEWDETISKAGVLAGAIDRLRDA